jgi:hypothetical protein
LGCEEHKHGNKNLDERKEKKNRRRNTLKILSIFSLTKQKEKSFGGLSLNTFIKMIVSNLWLIF